MKGQANLDALIAREDAKTLEDSDYPLLGLINLARLDHRQLVATKNTTELKNKLEGAGNYLTKRIVKYWSQNQHIKMEFDVRDAKPEDPEGMRQGINVWGEVYDTVHWAHTPRYTFARLRLVLLVSGMVRGHQAPEAKRDPATGRAGPVAARAGAGRPAAGISRRNWPHINSSIRPIRHS